MSGLSRRAVRLGTVVVIVVLVVVAARSALTPTRIFGYRVIDNDNLALQVVGSQAQWRNVTVDETPSTVTVELESH